MKYEKFREIHLDILGRTETMQQFKKLKESKRNDQPTAAYIMTQNYTEEQNLWFLCLHF